MAKNLGTLTVWLNADTSRFGKGMTSADKMLRKFAFAAKAGAAAAAASIAALATVSVKEFMKQEKATNALSAALRNAGDNADLLVPKFSRFADEMQKQTVYGNDAVIAAMAYGKNLGINADQMEAATTAAAGLAAKYGMDLQSAMMLVGRASQGQTQMLTRYGIVLDDSLDAQGKFNQLLKIGADSFGLAEAETKTLAGSLTQLSNNWDNLKRGIGEAVVEALNFGDNVNWLSDTIVAATDWVNRNILGMAHIFKELVIEIEFGAKQIGFLIYNIGNIIAEASSNSGANIANILIWVMENFTKLAGGINELVFSAVLEWLNLVKGFWGTVWDITKASWDAILSIFSGGSISDALTGIFDTAVAGFIDTVAKVGSETERALKGLGVTELKLEAPDYAGVWGKLTGDIDRLEAERVAAMENLLADSMAKAGLDKPGRQPAPGARPGDKQTKGESKMESSIVSAVQKGSAEALKIENTRSRKEDKLVDNTDRTARNTERMAKAIEKLSIPATGGVDMEDAFA